MAQYKVEFTELELKLLLAGLGNGIGDDAIAQFGFTKVEMATLGRAANKLHKAYNGSAPYYENASDY